MASDLVYDNNSALALKHGIKKNLRFSAEQMKKAPSRQNSRSEMLVDGTFPATGKHKLLLLLVNYNDTKPTFSREDFDKMMNQNGYKGIGSFRDYYLQQSYGKLDIDVTVTDWINLPKPKGTYGPDGAPYMIYDALKLVTDTLDLRDFDNDGDGILDGLAVIHQGTGQEASADANDIWSHSAIIYGQTFNGVSVRRYTIEPECLAKNISSDMLSARPTSTIPTTPLQAESSAERAFGTCSEAALGAANTVRVLRASTDGRSMCGDGPTP